MHQTEELTSRDTLTINLADVNSPESADLLARLTAELAQRYNDDGVGDFRPGDMDQPRSGFLVGRLNGKAVACGAFRPLEADIAEIKRMFVDPAFRGRGYGRCILEALEEKAVQAGFARTWLETGTGQPEAVMLYEGTGYRRIPPYGFYRFDPRSICFEKVLLPG